MEKTGQKPSDFGKGTWLDYIIGVMEGVATPLHESEIARRVIEAGYPTQGLTPARTINRVLNENPNLFERLGEGYYRRR